MNKSRGAGPRLLWQNISFSVNPSSVFLTGMTKQIAAVVEMLMWHIISFIGGPLSLTLWGQLVWASWYRKSPSE